MTERFTQKLKTSKNHTEKMKSLKISPSASKGWVISVLLLQVQSAFLRSINLLESPRWWNPLSWRQCPWKRLRPHYLSWKTRYGFQSFNLFENLNVLENAIVAQTTVLKRDRKALSIAKLTVVWEQYWKAKPNNSQGTKTTCGHCPVPSLLIQAILFDSQLQPLTQKW